MKGDAEREREQERNSILSWLKVGQKVNTLYGSGIVKRIYKKSVSILNEEGNLLTLRINYINSLA
jgi:hypothetical protein